PLINARIRKRWRAGGLKVGRVGPVADLTYPVQDLGNDGRVISAMAADRHPFCETLRKAMRPMLILGVGALRRKDGNAVQEACFRIAENCGLIRKDWCGYNMLHDSAGRVGALLAGFLPGEGGKGVHDILVATREKEIDILYLLGADEIHASRIGEDTFVIYQGHHSDRGAHRADLIFPAAAYSEKDALYVNTEGRVQAAHKAVQPPGKTKEDWRIIRRLSDELGRPLSCDDHATLRARLRPVFERTARWAAFGRRGTIEPVAFMPVIDDFYRTDPISRASPVMAECARIFTLGEEGE
ncbi:MAG: molybdopterin-dependent oxidoreductase, partial [Pseudomonadota bacterium]|nr:molybdopterin-dependent oxidoreductase [Pseudomonadota bacterium]